MTLENLDPIKLQAAVELAGAQWQAGVTSLSQLSDMEKRMRLGYVPAGDELSLEQREQTAQINAEVFKSAAVKEAFGYPASYDLRNGGFVTPVKDQGGCGSCVAFGTAATVESTLRVIRNNPNLSIDLAESQLFYCYARAQGRTCGNGWWMQPAMDACKTGVADEACYPYTAGDQNCSNLCSDWQNRAVKISGWHEIKSTADMKTWISTRGSLAACFTVYNDFFSYRSGIYRNVVKSDNPGGHCISVVGYNDAEGYWICKNSWGKNWGESGFFKIAYGECGIDATMWAVDGIVETGWLNSVKILGLWSNDADRNAYVYVSEGIGWRRIAFDTDNVFFNMLVQLATAKAGDRVTNLYQENGVIKQIYVF